MVDRVSPYEAPARFTVKGKGHFPFDMLRHDQAWPATTDAATAMSFSASVSEGLTVELIAYKRRHITPARWRSFGWVVTEIEGEDQYYAAG
jgi:hypothetical protein